MNDQQNQFLNALENFKEGTVENVHEKRRTIEHITLLIATILGFSVALTANNNGVPNNFLVTSWVLDIVALMIGGLYLIGESNSRFYRVMVASKKQAELISGATEETNFADQAGETLSQAYEEMTDSSQSENWRQKFAAKFSKHQERIEMAFFVLFFLSLLSLLLSLFS